MNAKFFHQLPTALHRYVDTFLNSRESARIVRTSSDFHSLSQRPPLPLSQRKTLKKFLSHVVHGERKQMHEMLQQNSQLLLQRDTVTDYSGRAFDSISGFEYALWALDKHLWNDMLVSLPRDEQGHLTEDGRAFVKQLLGQLEQVKAQKITYKLHGKSLKESHYDFAIIDALQEYMNAYNAPGKKNWKAIGKQWCEAVGGAQRLAPVHVVDEYCSDTSFYPVPQFDSRPQPANNLRRFHHWQKECWESWFEPNSELGVHFAIYKARSIALGPRQLGVASGIGGARGSDFFAIDPLGCNDLTAMSVLYETRKQDFIQLEAQLNSLLDFEEQSCLGI